jgi:glutamyl/glutaminyl-tRNA synthetase
MEKEGRRPSLRFATPRGMRLDFEDAIHGRRVYDLDDLSDFIIMRPDGWPTYIFAAAVDDHLMNITHIIRGDEHLDNAARQILIYDALGWDRPIFAHIPTILDAEKRKLSKRFGAVSIAYYRSLGYLPEALVAYLATLSWSIEGSDAVPTLYDLAKRFSLDQISSSPPIHDEERLRYWGKLAIKKADLAWLAERVIACAGGNFKPVNEKAFLALIDDVRGDCATLVEIAQKIAWLFQRPQKCEGAPPWISELIHVMRDLKEWNAEEIGEALKSFCREKGIKGKDFYHLLRTMLTGARDGSSVALVLWSLGRDEALLRLE